MLNRRIYRAATWTMLCAGSILAAGVNVLTQHNDADRTGANLRETILTPANVTPENFGKLFDLPVDGQVYAQPLVVSDIEILGRKRNVLVVPTQHNSIYLFDADSGERIWQKNFGRAAETPNPHWNIFWFDAPYHDLTPEIGITSTPVIDPKTDALYFTSFTQGTHQGKPVWNHWLHALNLRQPDGPELFGAPVDIRGSGVLMRSGQTYGHGRHYAHGADAPPTLGFDPGQHLQRPSLLLAKGRVLFAFGPHADSLPYQGWVFSYDASNLRDLPGAWISAERALSGIWQSGMGLTTDDQQNVLLITGNGFFDGAQDFGDSIVKLGIDGRAINLLDYFAPCNQDCMRTSDMDLGSSGMLHLPGSPLVVGGGKQGRLYLLDTRTSHKDSQAATKPADCNTCEDKIQQRFQASCGNHIHGSPVFWRSASRGPAIYVWAENDVLRAYPFNDATQQFDTQGCGSPMPQWTVGAAKSPAVNTGMTGGMLSVSANGGKNGIIWATTPYNNDANPRIVPGILRAYDAADLTRELWNSHINFDRDDFGNYAKFTPPTVANGKVYVPTLSGHVSVYGLQPPAVKLRGPNLLANGDFEQAGGWTPTSHSKFFVIQNSVAFPCQGPYSGAAYGGLYPTEAEAVRIAQTVTAPQTGWYTLRASCATNVRARWSHPTERRGVALGVSVGGKPAAPVKSVEPFAGYREYSVRFRATQGERITAWYRAPRLNWKGLSCQERSRWYCYPEAGAKFDLQRPERSCLDNDHSAWAVIDNVSLQLETQR